MGTEALAKSHQVWPLPPPKGFWAHGPQSKVGEFSLCSTRTSIEKNSSIQSVWAALCKYQTSAHAVNLLTAKRNFPLFLIKIGEKM